MQLGPYAELEFDLAGALRDRLIHMFGAMPTAPLDRQSVTTTVPNEQGVYQLFYQDELVYIGKTDAQAGLLSRLLRHAEKVRHRQSLNPADISFKAIRLFVFTVMDLETELLQKFKPAWNGGGFGSNDPGRERDTTKIKAGNFDDRFPIDLSRKIDFEIAGQCTAEAAIAAIRSAVPWKLRSQNVGGRKRACHDDLSQTYVTIPSGIDTAWGALSTIVRQLPTGWQATALKSHVILYKEAPREYPAPQAVIQSS